MSTSLTVSRAHKGLPLLAIVQYLFSRLAKPVSLHKVALCERDECRAPLENSEKHLCHSCLSEYWLDPVVDGRHELSGEFRDMVLGINWSNATNSVLRFQDVSADKLVKLATLGLLDEKRCKNAPSGLEIADLCAKYPFLVASGTAVSATRPDFRTSIDCVSAPPQALVTAFGNNVEAYDSFWDDFMNLAHGADESVVSMQDGAYAWWD